MIVYINRVLRSVFFVVVVRREALRKLCNLVVIFYVLNVIFLVKIFLFSLFVSTFVPNEDFNV